MTQSCHGALTRALVKLGLATALVVGLALVGVPATSAEASTHTSVSAQTSTTTKHHKTTRGERAVRLARSRQGDPYRYGGTGPHAFDCSGLTRWVYKKLGVRLPHRAADQVGRTYRIKHPHRGDLVFFYDDGGVYHVGIYAGHHKVWHAPYSGSHVKKERIWTHDYFIRRVKRH